MNRVDGTFSILAISPDSKFMGVAVASGSTSVGDRVPYAKPGVGVIATQAYTNVIYGIRGLDLLAKGLSPQEALSKLLREDSERDFRQVAIMDFKKRKAVFTGAKTPEFSAEKVGQNHIVIGNFLSSNEVVNNMVRHFEFSLGGLAWRMVGALKVGSESGGDKRGEKSAALLIVGAEKVEVEIKIALHKNPIEQLSQKLKSLTT
ncbi:DUF1028 domain-containing protein [Candidatus Bathyarchaeota archaeon]|nr:DUF1028 domain-containing protein [Candidatus Bathyarchaeota archaeon]